jgi:peptidyl-prolyl cis-trans isomerase B (cyclophilin B)
VLHRAGYEGQRAADSFFSQDIHGVADTINADENLDTTSLKPKASSAVDVAKPAVSKESEKANTKTPVLTSSGEGLSAAQKLFFVGAIVAMCAIFLRSRSGKSSNGQGFKDKSMA